MLVFVEQTKNNREYKAELYGQQTAPEKLTVLVVESMKEPYVKEIDTGCLIWLCWPQKVAICK